MSHHHDSIEIRRGIVLHPHTSPGQQRRFESFDWALRELQSALDNNLLMAKLRALLTPWQSVSAKDDHMVLQHIATTVAQGTAHLAVVPPPPSGKQIIANAKAYLGVAYSQNVAKASTDNKPGTTTGIDCSHLISFTTGLSYMRAEDLPNSPGLRPLGKDEVPQDGDVVVFEGGGHVVLWDSSPPKSGANLLGATVHHGVAWLPMTDKSGKATFEGTAVFFRLKRL